MGVIKIAKQGFDITKNNKKRETIKKAATPNHMYLVLALIFLSGAKKQVKRYQESIKLSSKRKNSHSLMESLHELFNLFEDLNALGKYVKICGDKTQSKQNKLWLDIRNHIRHDVREEFDNENKKEKNGRARRLKLDNRFQMDIECDVDQVRIGSTIVAMKEIEMYLDWTSDFFKDIRNEAEKKGFIRTD